jgi:hypothetical protein
MHVIRYLAFFVKEGVFKGKTANLEGTMKIRSLSFLAFILVILGMVIACDDPNSSDSSSTNDKDIVVKGATLAEKLQWVASNAASNKTYILEVKDDDDKFLNPHVLSYNGKSNITIQLTGIGGVKTVELYNYGSLFTISNGVTLVLNRIALKCTTNNTAPLVMVDGGNLIINNDSKITGNRISSSGSGVYVNSGTFTMNGGEISDNASSSSGGGGVYVGGGTFTMNGGKISGNTANSGGGGGVYVGGGVFTMTGGEISGNTTSSYGGGVYIGAVSTSKFEKTGGTITGYSSDMENGNRAYYRGHAVYAAHSDDRFIRYKEFTAGPQNNLTYTRNEPNPPIMPGNWNLPIPEAPDAPVVTASSGSLIVQWTAVERALAYEVWMGTMNNSAYATKHTDVLGVSSTLTDLAIGTTYYIWLKAKNDTGTSEFSPVASGTPSSPVAPQDPPAVSIGNEQITVTWTAVQGATAYEIWLGTENNSATAVKRGEDVSGTSVTLTNLANGITYYVWIKAKNSIGTSGFSPSASGKPTGGVLYKGAMSDSNKIGSHDLSQALTYISANAASGDNYFIVIGEDEYASPMTLDYSGKTVGITLLGYGGERTITLASNGSMFSINTGVTLTLEENITLVGLSTNIVALIRVNSNGTFTMNGGTISGNTNIRDIDIDSDNAIDYFLINGGGIIVFGIFTMNGGTISGNTAAFGGGISVFGTITMNGGKISGNTGGGVHIVDGYFTMTGGEISGNTAAFGGIYIDFNRDSGTFKKLPSGNGQNSGIIYGPEETGVDADGVPLRNSSSVVITRSSSRNTTAGQTDYIDTTTSRGLSASGEPPYGQ